jgi:hypothetical protein
MLIFIEELQSVVNALAFRFGCKLSRYDRLYVAGGELDYGTLRKEAVSQPTGGVHGKKTFY